MELASDRRCAWLSIRWARHHDREHRHPVSWRDAAPGRRGVGGGPPSFDRVARFGAILHIRAEQLARAELFYARHGDKAILGGRFILGLRTWGSMLAGMSHMPFWRFQVFSAAGGLLWAALIGIAGYVLGSNLPLLESIIRAVGIGGLTVLLLIALALIVAERRAVRRR
ncbi:MAG: DedA family protein [Chloroflexi bacterium]|nr:MAG: DedA family protein [Chloroflexota bacterium]